MTEERDGADAGDATNSVDGGDPTFGYTWGQTDAVTWLRNDEGDYKRVEPAFLEILRSVNSGERAVTDLDQPAVSAIETLREEGYLEPGGAVRRVETPAPIDLRPRLLAFGVVFALLTAFVIRQVLDPFGDPVDPGEVDLVRQLVLASGLFLGMALIHEAGHYVAASRYFDPTVRPTLLNGFIPALVTRTTAAWECPRSARLWISLAGPFADAVATLALGVGALTVLPGGGLLATFVVLEYVRILFSLNPLLQSDGYWVLVDGLGLTNLNSRGGRDLRNLEPTWAAAYVVASSAFSLALLGVMVYVVSGFLGFR